MGLMTRMEYTGPIPELQGKIALVMSPPVSSAFLPLERVSNNNPMVSAQFDEPVTFNGERLDLNWHYFLLSHFTTTGAKPVF